jgi:hypothetical protein
MVIGTGGGNKDVYKKEGHYEVNYTGVYKKPDKLIYGIQGFAEFAFKKNENNNGGSYYDQVSVDLISNSEKEEDRDHFEIKMDNTLKYERIKTTYREHAIEKKLAENLTEKLKLSSLQESSSYLGYLYGRGAYENSSSSVK